MNLKNVALSLLDIFRLNNGRKIIEEPIAPLAPLLQRLDLPEMPNYGHCADRAIFVLEVIQQNMDKKKLLGKQLSKRVLGKICRHYGVNLRGRGFFRAIPGNKNMLRILPA